MYCIYKATNKITGGVYIGKTNNLEKRKREHITDKRSDHLFQRALRKYGLANFDWVVLEDGIPTNQDANTRESYWIAKYNSYFRDDGSNGYNMTRGGDGGSCWNVRKIAAYTRDGKLHRVFDSVTEAAEFYGISGTSSVSKACSDFSATSGGMRFRYADDEPPKAIEVPGYDNPRWTPVLQYTTSGDFVAEYKSMRDVEAAGFRRTGVIGCARGRYKQSQGYVWVYKGDSERQNYADPIKPYGGRMVRQFSLDGEFLGEFFSCADAARKCGIGNNKGIHRALKSDTHRAYGFLWYRSDDVNMPIPR